MANIRKLLLWKTTLKGVSNTEGLPDVHVPPDTIAKSYDLTSNNKFIPETFYNYTGGGYGTEAESGYVFATKASIQNPGTYVGVVDYAIVDPTQLVRTTYSNWEMDGQACFDIQNKYPDPYPYFSSGTTPEGSDGAYTVAVDNWQYSQPLANPNVGTGEDWGNLVTSETFTMPTLFQNFFAAAYIQGRSADYTTQSVFNGCTWKLETASPAIDDPWTNTSNTTGYNWKYRYLDTDGSEGWIGEDGYTTVNDTFRHGKTVPNTAGLGCNYWLTTYRTNNPGVWNEYEESNTTLTTGEIPGWQLWNDGSTTNTLSNMPNEKKDLLNAGIPRLKSAQGDSLNIAFEIELALYRYGVSNYGGYNVTGGGGNYGNLIAYRAGNFCYNHEDLVSDSGSHIYIPCYAMFEPIDFFSGDIPSVVDGPIARYVIVALKLRQKYNAFTVVPGSGIVLDASQRSATYQFAENSGLFNGQGNSETYQWDATNNWPSLLVKSSINTANSLVDPITSYRLSENGVYHFISGGDRLLSYSNPNSALTPQRRRCITRQVMGRSGYSNGANERSQGFAHFNAVESGHRRYYWGEFPSQGLWYGANDSGRDTQICHLPDCDYFPGWTGATANGSGQYKNTFDYSSYRISCFRWSNDGRFLYVMWDDCLTDGRVANTGTNNTRCFIERYWCSSPLKYDITPGQATTNSMTEGLYLCGRTHTYTQYAMGTTKSSSSYIYPPSSFEITPDGQYLQLLMDPFREGKPFMAEYWLGGDDLGVEYHSTSYGNAYQESTSPEYALTGYDSTQSGSAAWDRKINWPVNTTRPGQLDPDWFPPDGSVPGRSTDGGTRTFIILGYSWVDVNKLRFATQSETNSFVRREVNTYPCDFDWSVDGTMLYLFQRYRDSDYGSRLSGSDRGMMELDDQPVMMQVPTTNWWRYGAGNYQKYPYLNTYGGSTETSAAYAFDYSHRIAAILRNTKGRYQQTSDSSAVAYAAYWPRSNKSNMALSGNESYKKRVVLEMTPVTYGTQQVLDIQNKAGDYNVGNYAGQFSTVRMAPDSYQVSLDAAAINTSSEMQHGNRGQRYKTCRDYIVVGRHDPHLTNDYYQEYEYMIDWSHPNFTGQSVHITDASGNDLSGKIGFDSGGTPGTDGWFKLQFYDTGGAANTLLEQYNPVYIRVGSNTSTLGFKIYHETPRPELAIMTPLCAVDNPGPDKPGHWASIRDDYYKLLFTSTNYDPDANGQVLNSIGNPQKGVHSQWVRVYDDAAVFNIAKNGRFLNFLGTSLLNDWDGNTTANASENRRVYTYQISQDAANNSARYDGVSNEYKSAPFGYNLGSYHDTANFQYLTSYHYFDTGRTNYMDYIMYGPGGITSADGWGSHQLLVQNDGNFALSLLSSDGIDRNASGSVPFTFKHEVEKDFYKQGVNGFNDESIVAVKYEPDDKSYAHYGNYQPSSTSTQSNLSWTSGIYQFSLNPQEGNEDSSPPPFRFSFVPWPTDFQHVDGTDYGTKVACVRDRRGGRYGFVWHLAENIDNGQYDHEIQNMLTFVQGNSSVASYRFPSNHNPNRQKEYVDSPFNNSVYTTSNWSIGTLNYLWHPPWRYFKLPEAENERINDNSPGYCLTYMDVEPNDYTQLGLVQGVQTTDGQRRMFCVKKKTFASANFHTNAFAHAVVPPANPNDSWTGRSLALPMNYVTYAEIKSGGNAGTFQAWDCIPEFAINRHETVQIRSIRFADNGTRLLVLVSGMIKELSTQSPIVTNVINRVGFTLQMFDLPTPYSLEGVTYNSSYTFYQNGNFYENNWWNSNKNNDAQYFGADFVFKPDGTKFYVIGTETTATSYSTNDRFRKTVVREFNLSTPFDFSTLTEGNETSYDSYAYDDERSNPCDLEVSLDGNTVYWSSYDTKGYDGNSSQFRMLHFQSPLSQNWNLLAPTTSTQTTQVYQGTTITRTQVGTRWYPSQGAGMKIRWMTDTRLYRTNASDFEDAATPSAGATFTDVSYTTGPLGGASSFDLSRTTQKTPGSFSFGNVAMFRSSSSYSYGITNAPVTESKRADSSYKDIFSFAVSADEDAALICDGQLTIYELRFNNDTGQVSN